MNSSHVAIKDYFFREMEAIQYDLNIKDMLWRNERLKKQADTSSQKAFFTLDFHLRN